jgi:hypothetical protein
MKRFLVFGLLGPFIGTLAAVILVEPLRDFLISDAPDSYFHVFTHFVFPFGYALGIIPALLVAVLDWYLERKGSGDRTMKCTVAGFLLPIPFIVLFFQPIGAFGIVCLGLTGAIPAAICSRLSGRMA